MKKPTVTIGIAAYNEEKTIVSLVQTLLSQKQNTFSLESIRIVSDGSDDKTVAVLKKIKTKTLIVKDNTARQGKAASLNQILKESSSDILLCMDADVAIKDKHFLEKFIQPIKEEHVDLAAAKVMELPVKNSFQKMLLVSMTLKKDIFERINKGRNIYTCHGRALAMSKRLYKKIHFPKGLIADDAYMYLFCTTNGFRYQYVKNAHVYYMLPLTNEDHQKQSHRFLSTQKQLYKLFGTERTKREYHLPKTTLLQVVLRYMGKNPMLLFRYAMVFASSTINALTQQPTMVKWDTARSSKSL